MPIIDPVKRRERWNDWWRRNKKEQYKKSYANRFSRAVKAREWLEDLKRGLKCSRCGFSHPAALDFHHVSGSKDFAVSNWYQFTQSITRIKKEIAKCEVLCANCHRIEHYEEKAKVPEVRETD